MSRFNFGSVNFYLSFNKYNYIIRVRQTLNNKDIQSRNLLVRQQLLAHRHAEKRQKKSNTYNEFKGHTYMLIFN